MRLLLANGLMWGNAMLAGQASIATVVGVAMKMSWRRHMAVLFPGHNLTMVTLFFIVTGLIVITVNVFGIVVSWKLRKRDPGPEAVRGCRVYNAMAAVVIGSVIASAYLTVHHINEVHANSERDLRSAMYQYFMDNSSRAELDNFHTDFKCCGVNNYTDWTLATKGAGVKSTGDVPRRPFVPRTCCVVQRKDGACLKYYEDGCSAVLRDYLDTLVPAVIFCVVCVGVWLTLLAMTSNKLHKVMREKVM